MSHAVTIHSVSAVLVCQRSEYLKEMVMANMTKSQHYDAWQKFADDCNRDSGYPHSNSAGIDKTALQDAWAQDFPGEPCPSVQWDISAGKYIVVGI